MDFSAAVVFTEPWRQLWKRASILKPTWIYSIMNDVVGSLQTQDKSFNNRTLVELHFSAIIR